MPQLTAWKVKSGWVPELKEENSESREDTGCSGSRTEHEMGESCTEGNLRDVLKAPSAYSADYWSALARDRATQKG